LWTHSDSCFGVAVPIQTVGYRWALTGTCIRKRTQFRGQHTIFPTTFLPNCIRNYIIVCSCPFWMLLVRRSVERIIQPLRNTADESGGFCISGSPLHFKRIWRGEARPEIWFRSCFYKEPIGTRFRAGPPGVAHKTRERWGPARGRPERFLKNCCFS